MLQRRHLKLASHFLAHRWRALHPFEVQAMLLNACNLRCVYCRCPEVKTTLLTTAQWIGIIRRLAALGTVRIKFQGGEPTLRSDFSELCAAARAAGVITAVTTNGLVIAERPALLDHLDEIIFSLDSATPEINDRLRGAGTHAQVVHAIDSARARGRRVYVNMVVSRNTLEELEPMLRFCEARGVTLHAQPVIFGRQYYDEEARRFALTPDEIRDMHRRLAEWKRQGRSLMFMPGTYARAAEWHDYDILATRSAGASGCMAGKYYVHIEANGDVHPCVQHAADFVPKNLIKDGIDAALRHVQTHNCGDCFSVYLNERKAVFGLQPSALLELLRRG